MYVLFTALPDSVSAGSEVNLEARTLPAASCSAKVKLHSGKPSGAPGLAKKQTADSAGRVAWIWLVDADPGNATATVSCKLGNRSASRDRAVVVLG